MSGPFFMGGPSQDEIERHRAGHEASQHAVNRLIVDMDADQLEAMELIFQGLSHSDNANMLAGYLAGRIATIRDFKFKVCAACGRDHDAEAEAVVEGTCPSCGSTDPGLHPATQADGGEVTLCSHAFHTPLPPHVAARRGIPAKRDWTPVGSTAKLAMWETEYMKEYSLDDLREEGSFALLGFVCLGCTQRYSTIQDRMIREPGVEGCGGCKQKAKWG